MNFLPAAVAALHLLVLLLLFVATLDKGWWVLPDAQALNLWYDCAPQNRSQGWECSSLGLSREWGALGEGPGGGGGHWARVLGGWGARGVGAQGGLGGSRWVFPQGGALVGAGEVQGGFGGVQRGLGGARGGLWSVWGGLWSVWGGAVVSLAWPWSVWRGRGQFCGLLWSVLGVAMVSLAW
uniref:Uncharacterized protein n=1 Tax=Corvus moneduloides TaxID=1196302 RepID=A0A8U7NIC1_CORMO